MLYNAVLIRRYVIHPEDRFPSDGSVLDFLGTDDGLEVSWYHRANSIREMEEALASDAHMVEADLLLRSTKTIPNLLFTRSLHYLKCLCIFAPILLTWSHTYHYYILSFTMFNKKV